MIYSGHYRLQHFSSAQLSSNMPIIILQVCMVLSSLYHTFSCRSQTDFDSFLMFDLFGIALSLLAIYTSGIYYAFWCEQVSNNTVKTESKTNTFTEMEDVLYDDSHHHIFRSHDAAVAQIQRTI